jgi:hypothetical protein
MVMNAHRCKSTRTHHAATQASLRRAVGHALRRPGAALAFGAGVLVAGLTAGADVAAQSFPAVIELSSLDGTTGFVLHGASIADRSGVSVSAAGDVNGDGTGDLIVGAFSASSNGREYAGESYVVFGRAAGFPADFELRDLHPRAGGDGSAGFIIRGIDAEDYAGAVVSGAGDVNGDGLADLLIGAAEAGPAGESYVVFGRATGFPAALELRSLHPLAGGDGSAGFILEGVEPGDHSACSVSGAGDVNGDGFADLLVGANKADANGRRDAGESYVVFGRATGFPPLFELRRLHPAEGGDGSEGVVLKGIDAYDGSGCPVSAAGDVNGDGVGDVLVGASGGDPDGSADAGEVYVVFGRATRFPALFELRSLHPQAGGDGSAGFIVKGIDAGDFAYRMSDAGDVNGDGVDDLLIGALDADPNDRTSAGESYVVFGRTTGFEATFELRSLHPLAGGDGSAGFILRGIDAGDYSGSAVSAAGDLNGDGIGDLLIGADGADPGDESWAGESYVVFGRATGFPASFELRNLHPRAGGNGSAGFILEGIEAFDLSGSALSDAGDINADGIDDVIVGAVYADPHDQPIAGESYVVYGRAAPPGNARR